MWWPTSTRRWCARSWLASDDPGGPSLPGFLAWLAEHLGSRAGQVDVVLAAPGLAGAPPLSLELRDDLARHHRVARAARYRGELRVYSSDGAVLVLGRGLAGRQEAAFEVEPARRGRGVGRGLALAARHLVPPDDFVFVQVLQLNDCDYLDVREND